MMLHSLSFMFPFTLSLHISLSAKFWNLRRYDNGPHPCSCSMQTMRLAACKRRKQCPFGAWCYSGCPSATEWSGESWKGHMKNWTNKNCPNPPTKTMTNMGLGLGSSKNPWHFLSRAIVTLVFWKGGWNCGNVVPLSASEMLRRQVLHLRSLDLIF